MPGHIITAADLLNNPPPGVDLTLVGGQALVYWTLSYQQQYPEEFPSCVVGSTYDLDFVVQLREACEACRAHWGGRFDEPKPEDSTPELGRLVFNEGDAESELQVDLLGSLFRLEKSDILKNRTGLGGNKPPFETMYVLSEWGTLLNRCYNSLSLSRYRHPEALKQLRNSLAIHRCRIRHLLDKNEIKTAQSESHRLLKFAANSETGIRLFLNHAIDLLDGLVLTDRRFEDPFVENGLRPHIARIGEKRARLERDRARRKAEKRT